MFSATTGYVGMWLAVRANVRTANAARESGLRRAVRIAFRAGGVAGMFTVGLGLFGATVILMIYKQDATSVLVGFGFGGALLAMFMRVGGGIFTKAADVGADLVGKVEQGIPEDDPRNAATIADNVGDNVGDCAGMAADLFESYEVTLVASLILGAAAYSGSSIGAIAGVMFPLFVRAVGVITSIIGILAVAPRSEEEHGMKAINRGFFISAVISADRRVRDLQLLHALLEAGLRRGVRPDPGEHHPGAHAALHRHEAPARAGDRGVHGHRGGDDGPGGLLRRARVDRLVDHRDRRGHHGRVPAGSLERRAPVLHRAHRHGHADHGRRRRVHGHVRAHLGQRAGHRGDVRGVRGHGPAEILGGLDAIGNSTKAITKGLAIATAVIAATSLFGSFEEALRGAGFNFIGIRVDHPDVLVGLLLGGSVAFLFSSLAIRAVGRAAAQVVVEVRNQFRDHPGIMDYSEKPDYGRVVDICTKTSLRELMTPGLLAVLSPVIAGFLLKGEALGAFLAGAILTGQLLAVMLSNSGGAWDNAKKYIEEGHFGGKGSDAHKAAVIGDTVGDPFKDTAGPALNPLIKVMNLVALLIAPLVVTHATDVAFRIAVAAVCIVILGVMIYISKTRKSELEDVVRQADAASMAAS